MTRFNRSPSILRSVLVVAAIVVATTVVATGCGVDSALVGGACATGYTDCDNVCVRTSSDPNNCGGCGNVCTSGTCVNGACPLNADAHVDAQLDAHTDARRRLDAQDAMRTDAQDAASDALHDGTLTDGATDVLDAGAPHDATTESSTSDAHSSDAKLPDGSVADAPLTDALADGRGDAHPTDAETTDSAPDSPVCTPPMFACGGMCISGVSDPDNCGSCGKVCLSGICTNGACAGSTSGNIVVIGDDYVTANVHVSEARVLTNAVFLPASNPIRVLSYEQYADHTQVTNVKAVLQSAATTLGRTLQFIPEVDPTSVPTDLAGNTFDVLLVYDQADSPANTLAPIGTSWRSSLTTFLETGGDVVVLDGASGTFPQMSPFLTSSGLLKTTGVKPIASGTQLLNVASGDSVGNSVLSPYAAQNDTVSFVTSEANGGSVTYVIDELSGGKLVPVVIHKTVTAP